MRQMKYSGIEWIGDIPEEWQLDKGKAIFRQRNERGNNIELQILSPSQKLGVVPQSLLEERTGHIAVKVKEETDLRAFKTIHKGDFCISLRSFQGGFEYSAYEGVVSPAYQVFYPIKSISDRFYRYIFKIQPFIDKMCSYTMTLRDGKNISFSDFGNSYIPYPPLTVQYRIADFLDDKCAKIDRLIAHEQATIDELKAYKQSVITEAVTKGLDKSVLMKDSGVEWIGEIPESWSVLATKRLFLVVSGATPQSDKSEFWDGDIKWITPADYKTEDIYINGGKRSITKAGLNSCNTTMIPPNNIIFSKRAPIGAVAINNGELCTNQGCLACIAKVDLALKYFYYLMSVFTEQYEFLGTGTTFKEISLNDFKDFLLTYPYIQEQQQIANYLDKKCADIVSLISIKQQKIEVLKEYKKSLIYEYVTGKIEVC